MTLQVPSLGIGELSPNLLEGSHLFPSDGLRAAGHLEDVVETLDDHTSEQVGEDVLRTEYESVSLRRESKNYKRTMLSRFQAMNRTNAQYTLPQSVSPKASIVHRG